MLIDHRQFSVLQGKICAFSGGRQRFKTLKLFYSFNGIVHYIYLFSRSDRLLHNELSSSVRSSFIILITQRFATNSQISVHSFALLKTFTSLIIFLVFFWIRKQFIKNLFFFQFPLLVYLSRSLQCYNELCRPNPLFMQKSTHLTPFLFLVFSPLLSCSNSYQHYFQFLR